MAERLIEKRAGALAKNRRRRLWTRIVSALGCVVVFCTVYALILPAITASAETFCGKEEHAHSDACYERQLTCGMNESEDSVAYGHAHSSSCYQEEQVLLCTLEESEDELDETGAVVVEGHTHGDDCYAVETSLICGEIESEDVVTEGHAHSDACYGRALACGKKEHKHKEACFSDKTADVETAAVWEATLPAAEKLEGVWAEDVLAVAESQLGYTESTKNYVVDEDAGYNRGYTRYGEWYGNPYGDWCAMFVSFCLHYAGVEKEYMPRDAGCQNWINTLGKDEWGLWRPVKDGQAVTPASVVEKQREEALAAADSAAAEGEGVDAEVAAAAEEAAKAEESGDAVTDEPYDPQPGDLVFFNWDAGREGDTKVSDHVGIVVEVIPATLTEPEKLKTIEGNSTDRVEYVTYEMADVSIMGYAELPENPNPVKSEEAEEDPLTAEERERVNAVIEMIDALPTSEEAEEQLAAYEEDEDWDAYEQYMTDVSQQCWEAHYAYEDLGEKLQPYVTNHDKLVDLEWLYTATTYAVTAKQKPAKDNSSKLTIVPSADTDGLIEVNLYDYGNNINDLYETDSKYPGFQQEYGSTSVGSSLSRWASFNFGNNITNDLLAGINGVTNKGGDINATTNSANSPIEGAMSDVLVDGYPALSDGTSLGYLFSNSSYATKQNGQSINGLFQYNDITGAYVFNSRENHAQFNKGSDTFTLYEQIISPNFMMYPFGNFLPFNDIVHDSAQASSIDGAYLGEIAASAQYKQDQGLSVTEWDEYGTLATQLDKFDDLMIDAEGKGWDAYDAVNQYFGKSGIDAIFGPASPELRPGQPLMDYIYSIDYDVPKNFYFGMDMKMTFMQPKNGLTGTDGKQEMVFYFTGDDDVWVYVDNKMFLDLSGIHRHVGGEIDFTAGEVRYYHLDVATGDVATEPYKTVSFAEILGENSDALNEKGTFKDYSTHSFNFYYMERGAGSGVCRMNFNFPLLKQNSISVSKEVSTDEADADLLGNPDYRFQVLKANSGGGKTDDLFIASNTTYTVYDENDNVIGTGQTDANGVFTLKAGQRAEFTGIKENAGKYYVRELLTGDEHGQYGDITVSGESTSVDYNVVVGQDTFTGLDSPVKDMSDGATSFRFNNQVTFTKLGALEISKNLTGYNQGQAASAEDFEFEVTLDGALLPVGAKYVIDESVEKTVETAGIVSVPAGSTAKISNVVAGTEFVVKETNASAKGYTVTYAGDNGVTTSGDSASGVILTEASVEVAVTNSENGDAVVIPVEKSIANPDGKEHAYKFNLVQVTDGTGATEKQGGLVQTAELAVPAEGSVSDADAFVITYLEKPESTLPVSYYYKVSEQVDEDQQGASVAFDETFYVIEVTLSKNGNSFDASITNVWKNGAGEPIENFSAAPFENVLLRDLIVEKQLQAPEGFDAGGLKFEFTVSLANGDVSLADSYEATSTDADGNSVETAVAFKDGEAVVELEAGESLRIHGLPYGSVWSVAETKADGFHTTYTLLPEEGDSEAVAGLSTGDRALTDSSNGVVFVNTGGYELPQTGGSGPAPYTLCGVLCLMAATFMFVTTRYRGGGVRGTF